MFPFNDLIKGKKSQLTDDIILPAGENSFSLPVHLGETFIKTREMPIMQGGDVYCFHIILLSACLSICAGPAVS